ncbi:TPA_asm: G [Leucadendron betacytorhabdovirus 1]|nr:TPA_asm: G [Leucadendron betacytorhabdovirus 1]
MIYNHKMSLLVFYLFSILSLTLAENITIPPITFCDSTSDHKLSVAHCLSYCMDIYNMNEPLRTVIYTGVKPVTKILAKCKKGKKKVRYTETWTFSKIMVTLKDEYLPPDYAGCLDAWKTQCNLGVCSSKPCEVPEEYHWASDTDREVTYYQVDASLEMLYGIFNETIRVITPGGIEEYSKGYKFGLSEENVLYMWDSGQPAYDGCYISGGHVVTCYPGRNKTIICPTEGLTLRLMSTYYLDKCGIHAYFDQGMLFSFQQSADAHEIYPPILTTEDDKINKLSESVRGAFQTRDALLCSSTCLALNFFDIGEIIRVNAQLYIKIEQSVFRYCYQDPTCSLKIPLTQCAGQNLIRVVCGHVEYWWKSNETHNQVSQSCNAQAIEPLNELVLDTGGERLKINLTGIYWEDNITNDTPMFGPIKGTSIIDLGAISHSAIVQVQPSANASVILMTTLVKTEVFLVTWAQAAIDWMASVSHQIKVWMISGLLTLILLLLGYKYLAARWKKTRTSTPAAPPIRYRIVPINNDEGEMIFSQ